MFLIELALESNIWNRLNQRATSYAKYVDFNSSSFQLTRAKLKCKSNLYYETGKYSSLITDWRLRRDFFFLERGVTPKFIVRIRNIYIRNMIVMRSFAEWFK